MSHMPVEESLNICDMSSAINSVELCCRRSLLSLFTQSFAPKLTMDERKTNKGYGPQFFMKQFIGIVLMAANSNLSPHRLSFGFAEDKQSKKLVYSSDSSLGGFCVKVVLSVELFDARPSKVKEGREESLVICTEQVITQ